MTKQVINIGSSANDGTGDPLRDAFTKANQNFTELYARVKSSAPSSNTGSSGDLAGMIAYDSDYIYICFADHDGSSVIWGRVSTTW